MSWYLWALGSAVFWGLYYVLISRIMTIASPVTVYWIPTIPLVIALPFYYKIVIEDTRALIAATIDIRIAVVIGAITSIIASLMFYKAIQMSNSTSASLIQISYPFFVALFAFILFHENQLTISILLGGLLIAAGTGIIIYNN